MACSAYEVCGIDAFLIPDTFVAGAITPEGPGRREGSEEGSAEGCTSQEHPEPASWAAAGSCLEIHPSSKEFSAFAGPKGIIDAAQMAQAALCPPAVGAAVWPWAILYAAGICPTAGSGAAPTGGHSTRCCLLSSFPPFVKECFCDSLGWPLFAM